MKAKVGDTVHVRGTVTNIENGYYSVVMALGNNKAIYEHEVVYVEPRKLAVGDRVGISANPYYCSGVILMIDCGMAWVKQSDGRYITADLKDLVSA